MSKGATHSTTWKKFELRVARIFGVERESKRGLGKSVPDVVAPVRFVKGLILSIECKLTAGLSKQVQVAIDESLKERKSTRHLPIAILKQKHDPDDNAVVAMRFKDFKKLFILPPKKEG